MLYVKALHIIFVVTWFAGLFYIVRLFVYFAEAAQEPEPKRSILQSQLLDWQKRLWYGITFPSAVLTLIFGSSMLYWFPLQDWLLLKIGFVTGLFVYHALCHVVFVQQKKGIIKYSGLQLRIWNEVATLFLFAIVFLVVLKNAIDMLWGLAGLIGLSVLLMFGIRWYKKLRGK